MTHRQVLVRYPFTGETIGVDAGLVAILEILWEGGVETVHSCQGDKDSFAYISYRPRGNRYITKVIHSMALPYVWWNRRDERGDLHGGEMWTVYWIWDWTVIAEVEAVLMNVKSY